MFKSPSICYTFFAIDDVTVMSVNTYTSVMGMDTWIPTNWKQWRNAFQCVPRTV